MKMAFMSTLRFNKPRDKELYFDMEFTGLHKNSTVISIGIVSDTNEMFYAELTDYDVTQCNSWIEKNVIANLVLENNTLPEFFNIKTTTIKGTREEVRKEFYKWVDNVYGKKKDDKDLITIFSDCLAYDWVLFIDLFYDTALNLDNRFYYIPIDLCTLLYSCHSGDPDVNREKYIDDYIAEDGTTLPYSDKKHNALWDAIVIKQAVDKAMNTIKWQSPY